MDSTSPPPTSNTESARIYVDRDTGLFGVIRGLKVYIDERYRGKVGHNETEKFEIPSGAHRMYVKMDWCRSAPVWINAEPGNHITYKVTIPSMQSEYAIFKIFYDMAFNSSRFFSLESH
jgi:hypothetical protein